VRISPACSTSPIASAPLAAKRRASGSRSSRGGSVFRTSIAKACRAAGVPLWSPHDLRHRRIILLHRQGRTWAEIGALVGQRSLKVTSDTYTHVLVDNRELDSASLLTRP
jgi:integrase